MRKPQKYTSRRSPMRPNGDRLPAQFTEEVSALLTPKMRRKYDQLCIARGMGPTVLASQIIAEHVTRSWLKGEI